MEESDKHDFAKTLIGVAQSYTKEINDFMIGAFWEVLRPYSWQDVKQAFMFHLGDTEVGQFMPKPADIKRRIVGNSHESAMTAWISFDRALRCQGPYRTLSFQDPIITIVIRDMGGLTAFAKATDKDYPFLRNTFIERYCMYSKLPELPHPKPLLGFEAMANNSLDVKLPEPIFIGADMQSSRMLLKVNRIANLAVADELVQDIKTQLKDDVFI